MSSSTARAVLLAALLGTALAYMSDDMLNLAILSVARDLRATDAQWILNAYYVSLVSCVIAAGAIGDIVGQRPFGRPRLSFLIDLDQQYAQCVSCQLTPLVAH